MNRFIFALSQTKLSQINAGLINDSYMNIKPSLMESHPNIKNIVEHYQWKHSITIIDFKNGKVKACLF